MTEKEMKSATNEELYKEWKKYEKKKKNVEQQLEAISHYMSSLDFELRDRFREGGIASGLNYDYGKWKFNPDKVKNIEYDDRDLDL